MFAIMNKIMLLISTTSTVGLMAVTTALAQNSIEVNKNGIFVGAGNSRITINNRTSHIQHEMNSFQHQRTTINLNEGDLKAAHILSITTIGQPQLFGTITINGVVVKTINNHQISINLSPYLSTGINSIEISGNYKPANDSIQIEFSGPGTKVTQQTGGNGILKQTLIIAVH